MEGLLTLWLLMMGGAIIGGAVSLLMFIGSIFFPDEKATKIHHIASKLFFGSLYVFLIGGGICFGAIFFNS